MRKTPFLAVLGLFAGLLSCEELAVKGREQSVYIAKFPGDKTGAVSFTFDDNCASSITKIAPLFEEYGLRATFFIVPGSITEWSKWKRLSDRGFEIGNHTMSHLNLTTLDATDLEEQINASFELIVSQLHKTPLSFAAPRHETTDFINSMIAQKHLFNRTSSRDHYFCQGWVSSTTQKDAIENIKESITKNGWYVVAAHGIGDGWEPITESLLKNSLEYCKKNEDQVVVETYQNISLYTHAQRHSTLSITHGVNHQTIKVESELSDEIFNYPLTLVIKNHQFPSPYKIYNLTTGDSVDPKVEPGNRLLISVNLNNTYQIRWREW